MSTDAEFIQLCHAARETIGLRLEGYRSRQLERRLIFFRQRHNLTNNMELAVRLRTDPKLRKDFADFITINVSEFFRNPDRFQELRERYLPALLQRNRTLRIWSAGCSIGAEIYSIALILSQLTPGHRHELLATDIDEASLNRCQKGLYQPQEVREVPDLLKKRYFQETPTGWQLAPAIRELVEFRRHDLLKDPFPQHQDLIVCRNVVIYFTDESKSQLYRNFYTSLRPGGLLFIGATESIFEARSIGLRYLGPCFYQKPATEDGK